MNMRLVVNGPTIDARYRDEDVRDVLVPMLRRWTELQTERGGRLVVFLAAPPGAGKSTLAAFLARLSREVAGCTPVQAMGMDGFHYPNAYLDAHAIVEAGVRKSLRSRKGAPFTFDVDALVCALEDVRLDDPAPWPDYSRVTHDIVPATIPIREKILLVEGNYLLLGEGAWARVAGLCDESVSVRAEEGLLRDRLVARKVAGGLSPEEAAAWYEESDGRNVREVLDHSAAADVELALGDDGGLVITRGDGLLAPFRGRRYFMTSERIGFSRWGPYDLDLARRLWGNSDVTRYICAPGSFSDDEVASRLALEIDCQSQHDVQYWPMFDLASGDFVGVCGLHPHGNGERGTEYDLGFHLLPEWWGRGYAAEAARAVIGYAFGALGARSLFAGHNPRNVASRRRLLSLGFERVGEEFFAPTGLMHPAYRLYSAD